MFPISKIDPRGRWVIAASCVLATSTLQTDAAINVESRDSTIVVDPFNVGFSPDFAIGTVGGFGPPDLILNSAAIDSSADLNAAGNLFYGPDDYGRVQSGTYAAAQDFTSSTNTLGGSLMQS